uniref:Uncharacterized protein n=1 Tax=Lepeophtheirus salmonis TaxID=72036 RepID=A0A0K2T1V0_LEPSM
MLLGKDLVAPKGAGILHKIDLNEEQLNLFRRCFLRRYLPSGFFLCRLLGGVGFDHFLLRSLFNKYFGLGRFFFSRLLRGFWLFNVFGHLRLACYRKLKCS